MKKNIKIQITTADIEIIKELCKEDNIVWKSSSYGGERFCFKISNEWKSQNSKYFKDERSPNSLSTIFKFITKCSDIPEDFSKKYNVLKGHENLLRRSYFDVDTFSFDDEDYGIWLAYKRPFGNSHVIGDVLEAFNLYPKEEEEYDKFSELADSKKYLLDETINIIKNFFTEVPFEELQGITNEYFSDFELSPEFIRKRKIRKLIESA